MSEAENPSQARQVEAVGQAEAVGHPEMPQQRSTTPQPATSDAATPSPGPLVGIIIGSQSDWPTLSHAADILTRLAVAHEVRIVSAHRTPERLRDYASSAGRRGLKIIIAGAGGAAHLPGMCASWTALPVLGVPVESHALRGMDSLLSIVQMPAGIPVGTLAIGRAGAVNAGLLAAAILAINDPGLMIRLDALRAAQTASVGETPHSGEAPHAGETPEPTETAELSAAMAAPAVSRPAR